MSVPANLVQFARLLRRAGIPVGPAAVVTATQALAAIDLGDRTQARAALRCVMVHRHDQADIFDQAFDLFWRDPAALL